MNTVALSSANMIPENDSYQKLFVDHGMSSRDIIKMVTTYQQYILISIKERYYHNIGGRMLEVILGEGIPKKGGTSIKTIHLVPYVSYQGDPDQVDGKPSWTLSGSSTFKKGK